MKTPTLVISAVLVSLVAVSQSAAINDDNVASYSIIDPIIKTILEKMRSKLADLKFDDINEEISNPRLNATVIAKGISIQNADTFVIDNLKSSLIPLKLTNLTLTWDNIIGNAFYDVDASIAIPEANTPARVFAKGDARAALRGLFLTVGANMELKGKVPQIKPKGLFGFDISIRKAEVTLSSLMGSSEFGKAVGDFISRIIPDLVDTLKQPVFEAFHDTIVTILNEILRRNSILYMDEVPEIESELFEDLLSWDELNYFPEETFDLKQIEFDSEV